ncbi:patatin-like phospholipase family protein [Chitinophaga sp. MM2321]|uniref:patatin-like phospholipase family protein n=1 Tax=Chitinophaga sp. MM2321 TaxID=3137178 RepID=UPI0032D5893A
MSKTALLISGGGVRSAFTVGVLKYLHEKRPDIQFDMLVGTGTGSLIVLLNALKETDLLEKFYTSLNTADIINTGNPIQRFTNNNSLYNTTPLKHKINSIITEARFKSFMETDKAVFIAGRCLQTKRTTFFSNKQTVTPDKDYDVVQLSGTSALREAVAASFSQPVFMSPVEVTAASTEPLQFMDGGGPSYTPIQLAIDNGATDIYVVLLTPEIPEANNFLFKRVIDSLERTTDWATSDIALHDIRIPQLYNKALHYLDAVKDNMKAAGISPADIDQYFETPDANPFKGKVNLNIHVIRPERPLGSTMGGMEFNPRNMKAMVEAGLQIKL